MQRFTNNNDLVPPSTLPMVLIDKTPPSPTSCCIEGGGVESPFVVTQKPPFGRRRNSMVSTMIKSQRRTTTPRCRVYSSSRRSVVSGSQFLTTATPLSHSVDDTLQSALEICTMENPQVPSSTSDDDVVVDEVLSMDAHRRDLLKDDMTLLYRELSRFSEETDIESFSPPSDSDLEDEDEDCNFYEVSTGNDGSVDFSKVRADFHRQQKISS